MSFGPTALPSLASEHGAEYQRAGSCDLTSHDDRPLEFSLDVSATSAEAARAAAARGSRHGSADAYAITSFPYRGAGRRAETIMSLATIALHLVLMGAAVILLMLLCSTGNFWRYPGAGVWIALDLMVSVTGLAWYLHPEYAALIPRLALFHSVAMWVCIAWMAVDCWRDAHALSGVFFWAFGAYAVLRFGQLLAYEWKALPPVVLEIVNAVGYLAAVGLLIASLLLPVPPETQTERRIGNPLILTPAPPAALATEARS